MFMVGPVISSFLFTWIYKNTNRSTLSAILFHFSINLSGELISLSELERCYQIFLIMIASLLVMAVWGAKTMRLPISTQENKPSQSLFKSFTRKELS
jgi:membrane protease YdiL (CAAX protease family)